MSVFVCEHVRARRASGRTRGCVRLTSSRTSRTEPGGGLTWSEGPRPAGSSRVTSCEATPSTHAAGVGPATPSETWPRHPVAPRSRTGLGRRVHRVRNEHPQLHVYFRRDPDTSPLLLGSLPAEDAPQSNWVVFRWWRDEYLKGRYSRPFAPLFPPHLRGRQGKVGGLT